MPDHLLLQTLHICRFHFGQGKTAGAAGKAHQVERLLNRDWIDLTKQGIHQRNTVHLHLGGQCGISMEILFAYTVRPRWRDVGKHLDNAPSAQGKDRDNLIVVARIDIQLTRT